MKLLDKAKIEFKDLIEKEGLEAEDIEISASGLSPEEAIGDPDRQDYPLLTGEEVMIQAEFRGSKGQAFTDHPGEFTGTLREVIELPLDQNYHRALLVASINAVLRSMGKTEKTVHCRDEEMEKCVNRIVEWVNEKYPSAETIGIIGFQPAMLEAFADKYDSDKIMITDLHPERIGSEKYGVKIWNGALSGERLIRESDFILATGSTITNNTIDRLVKLFNEYNKPYRFYGNTISGAAFLLDIPQLCFFGR